MGSTFEINSSNTTPHMEDTLLIGNFSYVEIARIIEIASFVVSVLGIFGNWMVFRVARYMVKVEKMSGYRNFAFSSSKMLLS